MKYKIDLSSQQSIALQVAFEEIVGRGTLESFEYRLDVPEPTAVQKPRRPRRKKPKPPEEAPAKAE